MSPIADRVAQVRERMAQALARAGRPPDSATLVAATKTRTPEEILQAIVAGVTDLGENYVQDWRAKRESIDKAAPVSLSWHMIGHLQRNKVKYLVPAVDLIHSVDSLRLAEEISRSAGEAGVKQTVLLEVNVAGEESKSGVPAGQVAELAEAVAALPHVELQGLMCMPPYSEDPETSRPHFRALARLAAELARAGLPRESLRHLSMGMSGDYEVALEEGATLIRLGTVLFGPRI